MMNNFTKFIVIIFVVYVTEVRPWTYEDQENWPQQYPNCGSNRQSPIEITTKEAIAKQMPPLRFYNYDTTRGAFITNNCHTAVIHLPPNSPVKPQISGGPLNSSDRYEFQSAHFHWSAEHTIDERRNALALHAVHINKKYSTAEAENYQDGFAVVTTFYRPSLLQYFFGLQNVNDALRFIRNCNATSQIKNFNLSALIGGVRSLVNQKYYTYKGSLTTPPCAQAVVWVIFPKAIPISPFQLSPFKSLLDNRAAAIEMNFRNLQKSQGRKIYFKP